MNKLFKTLRKLGNWKAILLSVIIYLAFAIFVMPTAASYIEKDAGQPVEILDLHLHYSVDEAVSILEKYTPQARKTAARFALSGDMAYPVAYTFLLLTCTAWAFAYKPKSRIHMICCFTCFADWGENILLIRVFQEFPSVNETLIQTASAFTTLKWSLFGLSVFVLLWGLLGRWQHNRLKKAL